MSSILKAQMAEQLKKVAEREGDPDLMDKICDERIATDVEGVLQYITEKNHPALSMPSLL
jgi:acetyl-CoA synthase